MTPPSFAWSTWHARASRSALVLTALPAVLDSMQAEQLCKPGVHEPLATGAHHILEGDVEPAAAHGHACNGGLPGGIGAHQRDQVYVPQHYPAIEPDVKDALPGAAPVCFRLRMPAGPLS